MFDKRVAERFREQTMTRMKCNRGRVLDFSTRGIRLSSKRAWRLGDRKSITIKHAGESVTLEAEATWTAEKQHGRWVVGVMFTTISPACAGALERINTAVASPGLLTLPGGEHIGLTSGRRAA